MVAKAVWYTSVSVYITDHRRVHKPRGRNPSCVALREEKVEIASKDEKGGERTGVKGGKFEI